MIHSFSVHGVSQSLSEVIIGSGAARALPGMPLRETRAKLAGEKKKARRRKQREKEKRNGSPFFSRQCSSSREQVLWRTTRVEPMSFQINSSSLFSRVQASPLYLCPFIPAIPCIEKRARNTWKSACIPPL